MCENQDKPACQEAVAMNDIACQEQIAPKPLKIGSIVNYVMSNGEVRPAICVKVWNELGGNFQVFFDGSNDVKSNVYIPVPGTVWMTSVSFSNEKRSHSWHWPE